MTPVDVNTVVIFGGGLFLFLQRLAKFREWPAEAHHFAPGHYTPRFYYFTTLMIYLTIYMAIYAAVALIPGLTDKLKSILGNWNIEQRDPAIFAVLFLTVGVSDFPGLKHLDKRFRRALYSLAHIPHEGQQKSRQCNHTAFIPNNDIMQTAVEEWCEQTNLDQDFILNDPSKTSRRFRRIIYILNRLEWYNNNKRKPPKFITRWIPLESIKDKIRVRVTEGNTAPDSHSYTENLFGSRGFAQFVKFRLEEVTLAACCMVYASYKSRNQHPYVFQALGFNLDCPTVLSVGFNALAKLAMITAGLTWCIGGAFSFYTGAVELPIVIFIWGIMAILFYPGTVALIHLTLYFFSAVNYSIRGVAIWMFIGMMLGGITGILSITIYGVSKGLSWPHLYDLSNVDWLHTVNMYKFALISAASGAFVPYYALTDLQGRFQRWLTIGAHGTVVGIVTMLAYFLYYTTGNLDVLRLLTYICISGLTAAFIGYVVSDHRLTEQQTRQSLSYCRLS